MIYAATLTAEIGFWILILAGLIARYPLNRPRLGVILLALTPVVDLLLLTAAVIDIRRGADAGAHHALAAIYLGVSLAFGPRILAWADARFAYRFAGVLKPSANPAQGADRARRERSGWYRHLAAWLIAAAVLGLIHLSGGNRDETAKLFAVLGPWLVILGIDFVWSFSYSLWPQRSSERGTPPR